MTKGRPVKRVLAMAVGSLGCAMVLMACSDDKGGDTNAVQEISNGGGATVVKVEGNDLDGLDLNSVTCVKQAGKINVASAAIGGQQGLGIVMTDAEPPVVESLGMVVDGNALAVTNSMGMQVGSADVSVDGDTYTITGEAQGTDMQNPMAGTIAKEFSVTVTCK